MTLTVTDNEGATATSSAQVSTTGNQAPTASFTHSATALVVDVNGSASSDPDGTIAAYSWNWGDGTAAGTGATASHSYQAAGTYQITLTVTDNEGLTSTATQSVTVAAVAGPFAADSFGRTLASAWGAADLGGTWAHSGPNGRYSVAGGVGVITMLAGGAGPRSALGVSQTDADTRVTVGIDKLPTGGTAFVYVSGRSQATNGYRAKIRVDGNGATWVYLVRVDNFVETTLTSGNVPGLTMTPTQQVAIRLQVEGTSPSTLRVKAWPAGTAEPADWRLTATDSTAALQVPGGIGLFTYLSGSVTNTPISFTFDDFSVRKVG